MAIIDPIIEKGIDKYLTIRWENLAADDAGRTVSLGPLKVTTVEIRGVVGGSIPLIQGTMDGVTFNVFTEDGTSVIAGEGIFKMFEHPKGVAAFVIGGDGTTDITITIGASRLI